MRRRARRPAIGSPATFLLLPALLAPAAALGYVMSAWLVLEKVAEHRKSMELSSLVVRGTFTFRGADAAAAAAALKLAPAPEVVAAGVVSYKMPGRCRVELEPRGPAAAPAPGSSAAARPAAPAAAVFVNGHVRTAGTAVPALRSFAAGVCPLLAEPSREELTAFLKSRGVDTASDTLGRLDGTVAFVIGGRPRDAGTPSFWVEKERFDPLRLVARDGAGLEDLRLSDYASPLLGEWHPRVVEIRRGGEDLTRFVADKAETNTRLPDALFQ